MNMVLQMEAMTINQLKQLIEKENIRKDKNRAYYKQWVADKKASGEFSERQRQYNAVYRAKKKAAKAAPSELSDDNQ